MKKIMEVKNIERYVILMIIMFFILIIIFNSPPNHTQGAQRIEITLKPCTILDNSKIYMPNFSQNNSPYICGEILSEYLPLELRYYLTNLDSGENLIFAEYRKFDDYSFFIKLPDDLAIGKYKFEIKAGGKPAASTYFEVR